MTGEEIEDLRGSLGLCVRHAVGDDERWINWRSSHAVGVMLGTWRDTCRSLANRGKESVVANGGAI